MIRGSLEDIALISDYLHDSNIRVEDINHDSSTGILMLKLQRCYYEGANEKKILLLIPITRYPSVDSEVRILKIKNVEYQWKEKAFDDPSIEQNLLNIKVFGDKLTVELDYLYLQCKLDRFEYIRIVDTSEPSEKYKYTDFLAGPQESLLKDIEKLRNTF